MFREAFLLADLELNLYEFLFVDLEIDFLIEDLSLLEFTVS